MTVSVNTVVVCDDIRREDNGKQMLIGVYPNNIYPYQFPAKLRLSFWIVGKTTEQENTIELRVQIKSKTQEKQVLDIAPMQIDISDKEFKSSGTSINLAAVGLPVAVDDESSLILQLKGTSGRWKNICEKPILIHPGKPA